MNDDEKINSVLPNILDVIRERGSVRLSEELLRPVRYVIKGNPLEGLDLEKIRRQMEIGVRVGQKIVFDVMPQLLSDSPHFLFEFIPFASGDYLNRYLTIHGLSKESALPLVSRTDMLVDQEGNARVLEINPDAPEGYALSKAHFEIHKLIGEDPGEHVYLYQYFLSAYLDFLRRMKVEGKVLVPYWKDGNLTPFDAKEIERDLRENGFEALAYPVEEIDDNFPYDIGAIIRIISVTTPRAERAITAELPFFLSNRFLEIPQFPPPWTDLGGLKHLLALLYRQLQEEGDSEMLEVLPPTYSCLFSNEQIKKEVLRGSYVLKEVNSSHGEGFINRQEEGKTQFPSFIAQQKIEGYRNPPESFSYIDQDGRIKKGGGWLIDCDPMGYTSDGVFIYVVRTCREHPMNVAGPNGGAIFSSFRI